MVESWRRDVCPTSSSLPWSSLVWNKVVKFRCFTNKIQRKPQTGGAVWTQWNNCLVWEKPGSQRNSFYGWNKSHKSFWLILGVNSHLIILLFPDDAVCVTAGDDRRLRGALQRIFIALCDLGVAFFPHSFFPFFTSSEKLWILFSDTVLSTRVVNISPAQKKNQTICFVVSQIKHFLLFW